MLVESEKKLDAVAGARKGLFAVTFLGGVVKDLVKFPEGQSPWIYEAGVVRLMMRQFS